MVFFSVVHTLAHMRNFVRPSSLADIHLLCVAHPSDLTGATGNGTEEVHTQLPRPTSCTKLTGSGFVGFLKLNFATGPGITGWIMWAALGVMVWFAMEKRRRAHFERSAAPSLPIVWEKADQKRFWYSHHVIFHCSPPNR